MNWKRITADIHYTQWRYIYINRSSPTVSRSYILGDVGRGQPGQATVTTERLNAKYASLYNAADTPLSRSMTLSNA
jgi:hypothetical protein